MANLSSIGRPYALAAFEYAREKQQIAQWKSFLETAALIALDKKTCKLFANPSVTEEQFYSLFHHILQTTMNSEQKNFLSLLAQNNRLNALPAISTIFNSYEAALEKMSHVRVVAAIEADEGFKQSLSQALAKRIQREVMLQCEIDPAILGGAIIHLGDRVIDGSIRGKLLRLLEFSLR